MVRHLYYSLIPFLFISACQMSEISEVENRAATDVPVILDASDEEKVKFSTWLSQTTPNARRSTDYDPAKLVKVANSTHERLAVVNNQDPNTSLSFVINPVTNQIDREMISTSIRKKDKSISSRAYNLQNKLMFEVVHKPDVTVEITYQDQNAVTGFWKEWDKCLGTIAAPFESNAANITFDAIASYVTLGGWLPSVAVVCLGVAGGLN